MKRLSILLLSVFFILAFNLNAVNDGSRYAPNSAMAEGKWVQIKTEQNAIYKLTYEDIKSMGFSDPSKVSLYGYGGWLLDENFEKPYVDDLPEVSVWMSNKNSFGPGDYLLFYGRGTQRWDYDEGINVYQHENNPYSLYGSYFIAENASGPKQMREQEAPAISASEVTLTTFDDYFVHEKDETAVINSGRELFGESFVQNKSRDFRFTIPGITSDSAKVSCSMIALPSQQTKAYLSIANQEILSLTFNSGSKYYSNAVSTQPWEGDKSENTVVTINYDASGGSYLNYILLNVARKLQFYNTPFTFFRNKAMLEQDVKYEIENANANLLVWDITGNYEVELVSGTLSGNKYSFTVAKDSKLREYVMVDPAKEFSKPEVMGAIKNQNLHGLPQVDMVIIVPELYYSYAEQLAERHREEGLSVHVVQPQWIYNEFSSGVRDASAYRRFMKMFYDRAETEETKPRYLLLYGDGIFDNRHLTKTGAQLDPRYYLLTYQVKNSTVESSSFGTDDYFGFLDDSEGADVPSGKDKLDIGIGRFPVSSVEQAYNAANKVINYINNKQYGSWKNKVLFAADNTDTAPSPFCEHGTQADEVATSVEVDYPEYMVYKSYMDAYKPVDVNGKIRIPDAKNKFMSLMKDGCFLFNYMGHGSPMALSGEDMLNVKDVRQMKFETLPVWITGTCDFAWFDSFTTSAGEEVFLNKNSAGIALFTTTRVVYSTGNLILNKQLMKNMFKKVDGKHLRLGDIMRISKCASDLSKNSNKLNFILLGDPALKLNYPEINVELEKINNEAVDVLDENGKEKIFNFRALDTITLEGSITDDEGNLVSDFNGYVRTTVFDSQQEISSYSVREGQHFTFKDYPNMVFIGNSDVKDGKFTLSFKVPLDISYTRNNGKINFYAVDESTGIEGNGSFFNYVLAGTSDEHTSDSEGPEINALYLNTTSFKNGDKVNSTPYFIANVYDKDGINMAGSGLGHDISIAIDNSPRTTYTLNSYYKPMDDGSGEIGFSIPALPNGEHTLVFTVWDIMNNSSRDSIHFVVDNKLEPNLYDLTASNNPAKTSTYFLIEHDRPDSQLQVEIFVYDLSGRAIWTHKEEGASGWLTYYPIEWNLADGGGNRVAPGIYVYKAIVGSPEGKTATKAKKLIVTGQ